MLVVISAERVAVARPGGAALKKNEPDPKILDITP
jgi:hypothetical protein